MYPKMSIGHLPGRNMGTAEYLGKLNSRDKI